MCGPRRYLPSGATSGFADKSTGGNRVDFWGDGFESIRFIILLRLISQMTKTSIGAEGCLCPAYASPSQVEWRWDDVAIKAVQALSLKRGLKPKV